MITHNSFKLVIEEKNHEAQRLRNELHNTKLERDRYKREHEEVFKDMFGCPITIFRMKEVGIVEVRTKSGDTLLFEIKRIGEQNEE
jgi:hypothetical protein